ncbi:MAG: conjugal transfer protein TraF [Candidatus Symbiodolus clandestinus]
MPRKIGILIGTWLITRWAIAQGPGEHPGFYERKSEGWFWYQQQPKEPDPLPTITQAPTLESSTSVNPPALSAAWLRENLPKYKDPAWDNPTVENLQAFLYLQRYAIDRSQQFSDSAELAVVGDWHLDETVHRPEAAFASQKVDSQAGAAKQQLIKTLAQRFGLFFFFNSNCPQSQLLADILQVLQRRAGFTVLPISLDGQKLPDDLFPNFKVDSGHAALLGIQNAPALFLASPEGEFSAVGYNAMSLPELEHRLLLSARRQGWLTPEQFNQTRPLLNLQNLASKIPEPESTTLPIPPTELIQRLRQESTLP